MPMPENRQKSGFRGPSPDVGKATQFKPGNCANPGGQPKSRWISELYDRQLRQRLPEAVRLKLGLSEGATYGHALAFRQVQKAIVGDTHAAKEITDRAEGKAVARFEHAGSEGASIEVSTEAVDAKLRRLLNLA